MTSPGIRNDSADWPQAVLDYPLDHKAIGRAMEEVSPELGDSYRDLVETWGDEYLGTTADLIGVMDRNTPPEVFSSYSEYLSRRGGGNPAGPETLPALAFFFLFVADTEEWFGWDLDDPDAVAERFVGELEKGDAGGTSAASWEEQPGEEPPGEEADVEAGEIWRTGEGTVPEERRSALVRFRNCFNRDQWVRLRNENSEALNLVWLASRGRPLSSDEASLVISFVERVENYYPSVVPKHLRQEKVADIFWAVLNWANPRHALGRFYAEMGLMGSSESVSTFGLDKGWRPRRVRDILRPYLDSYKRLTLGELQLLLPQLEKAEKFYRQIGNDTTGGLAMRAREAVAFLIAKEGMKNGEDNPADDVMPVGVVDPGIPAWKDAGQRRKGRRSGGGYNAWIPFFVAQGLSGEVNRESQFADRGSWIVDRNPPHLGVAGQIMAAGLGLEATLPVPAFANSWSPAYLGAATFAGIAAVTAITPATITVSVPSAVPVMAPVVW
ncbi:MAG: hypothetical protein HYU99_06190 [Deltaproteobacteria bacterium]|nr:hypothetical protein [Deltaproteobacteria bacterium]